MTTRQLGYIVREQRPVVLAVADLVETACRAMWERRTGSVLVSDNRGRLVGIFTGRDAIKALARSPDAASLPLLRVMTKHPIKVAPAGSALDALEAMDKGGFRHVPVVEGDRIVGVVSRGDFKGMEFEMFRWRSLGPARSAENRPVAEIVKGQKPVILSVGQTVSEAARLMSKANSGSVLVVDARQRLKGIFTGRDAVRVLARSKYAGTVKLGKAMTADPATISPDAHAIDALRLMNDGGFRHVPVVDAGKIVGLVARSDFSGREIDRLDEDEHLNECIW